MNKKFYGFTLVEAVVSICILTILSTIGFVSYSSYTKDSRDANRVTAVANIQESIEQIKMKNAKVPNPENITGNGVINGVELFKIGIVGDLLSQELHLNNTPQDPLNKNNYSYGVTKNNKEYQIATILENKSIFGFNQKTYADFDNTISKVNGNYDGLITYNSGGNCLVNVPSLIVSTGGTFDVSTTDPGYVIDKGENIPFLQNSKKIIKENKQNIVLKKTNSQTGGIAGICNINFATQSGSLRYVFGESGKKIGENLGILVKEEPKIDKPLVCETDLTQTNIDNLNTFFSGSAYSGSTKAYWCGLTSIVVENNTTFSGRTIPDDIGYLTNTTELTLNGDNLIGIIPSSIGNLLSIIKLDLGDNKLTGNIPTEIGNLNNLVDLSFNLNLLNGSIPNEIGNLSKLLYLDLGDNKLTGNIPTEIGNLNNLIHLYVYSNKLTGSIPASIGNLLKLEILEFCDNNLTGNIPTEIGKLTKLNWLLLYTNQLSGNIPIEIGNLSKLTYLNMGDNQLTGSIPTTIGYLTELLDLSIDNNNLTGSIPTEIGNLTKITSINFQNNQLSGSIPAEIGNLTKLTYLRLDNNQLSGNIPAEIGNLIELYNLELSNNLLTSIPTTIGNLKKLWWLNIRDNKLSGNLPTGLTGLTKLSYFIISNNLGLGSISSNFDIYYAGNKHKSCQNNNPIAGQKLCIDSVSSSTGIIFTVESMP